MLATARVNIHQRRSLVEHSRWNQKVEAILAKLLSQLVQPVAHLRGWFGWARNVEWLSIVTKLEGRTAFVGTYITKELLHRGEIPLRVETD